MKSAAVDKLIEKARGKKVLPLDDLDTILEDDDAFDFNVDKLNTCMDDCYVVELPCDILDSGNGGEGRSFRSPPFYSSGSDFYFQYINELRKNARMDRAEEYLFSKRLEFFKRRLIKAIQDSKLTQDEIGFYFQNTTCFADTESPDITPLCEKLHRCLRGKKYGMMTCCQAYNRCRSVFVERNLHLVVNLVMPYRTYGLPFMDLVQEGNTALIRAVEKYDWRKKVRFQTYAAFWIRQAVERLITANKGIVRIPNYIQQKLRRFKREGKLSDDRDQLSASALSDAFDLSREVAGHLLESDRGHVSLSLEASSDDETTFADLLAEDPEEIVLESETEGLKRRLREALGELSDQEQTIIRHRFGIDGAELKTLEDLGATMNISRERIRQIQLRALQKLKNPRLLGRLESYL